MWSVRLARSGRWVFIPVTRVQIPYRPPEKISMIVVYVLESMTNKRYYIGQTQDIAQRLDRHNSCRNRSTRANRPWCVKYTREFANRDDAVSFERYLKSLKKRRSVDKAFTNT